MQFIKTNPFRVIGILIGTDRQEEIARIQTLKETAAVARLLNEDYSFSALGGFDSTFASVRDAEQKLNNTRSRLEASLFWFYNGNIKTDTLAFAAMAQGKLNEALKIWESMTRSGTVKDSNASAFHNLGTLYLSGALDDRFPMEENLREGLELKLKFLESYCAQAFLKEAVDKHFKMDAEDLQRLLLWKVLHEITEYEVMRYEQFVAIIMEFSFSAQQDFLFEVISKYS